MRLPLPPRPRPLACALLLGLAPALSAPSLRAQSRDAGESRRSLDLGVNGVGLSIGDSRRWRGVRLNLRDSRLERVEGVNLTVLAPRGRRDGEFGGGDITGLALGVPVTGGREVRGLQLAIGGVGASGDVVGIGVNGLGVGAGGTIGGGQVAGLGLGAGGDVRGLA
ncbi:MAG TPA: hypothetical protein PKE51_13790, partial [Gemmatimonadaceae bacterium]|nr:hypothetical protein [Gemmatimonadaceae bacterium]